MTNSPTEDETYPTIHQFIQKFKNRQQQTRPPVIEESTPPHFQKSSEDTQSQQHLSLKEIIKTLADRLQIAQNEIEILKNEKTELIEQHHEEIAKDREHKRVSTLEKGIQEEDNSSNPSIDTLKKTLFQLQSLMHEKDGLIHRLSTQQESTLRERNSKMMALSIQTLEDELQTLQCEKNMLQRELKYAHTQLKISEEKLTALQEENSSLQEKENRQKDEILQFQEAFELERLARIERENASDVMQKDLLEKIELLSQVTDRYQQIELLLAEKVEKEIVLQESFYTLEESCSLLQMEKESLLEKNKTLSSHIELLHDTVEKQDKKLHTYEENLLKLQESLQKAEKIKNTLEQILESSLLASDWIKKAHEALLKAHGAYFSQSEDEKTAQNFQEISDPVKPSQNSYNLF